MRLTSDRLIVGKGERLRAVVVVETSVVAFAAAGGLAHLRHTLEDVGFRASELHMDPPATWGSRARAQPIAPGFSWPAWLEMTSLRAASYARELTEDLRIVDAWTAPEGAEDRGPEAYPLAPRRPMRLVGFVAVFGAAYPLFALAEVTP